MARAKTLVTAFRIGLASVVLLAAGCGKDSRAPQQPQASTGGEPAGETAVQQAPKTLDFVLKDHAGKEVSLSDFSDKIVVLEWVNPDCPFVQRHYAAGTFSKLSKKHPGVVWLAVNSTHYFTQEKNRAFHAEKKLGYPILDDHTGVVGKQFGAKTTPHLFVLKDGVVVYSGAIDDDAGGRKARSGQPVHNYVDAALTELKAGKTPSTPRTEPYGCSVKYAQ